MRPGEIADLQRGPHRTKKTCFFCRTGFEGYPLRNSIQPFDLMSRRHPLSSTWAFRIRPASKSRSSEARVTCRHQAAGILKEAKLLLLLGNPTGLLRSLLHCALRLLRLLRFLGHVALL